MNLSDRLRETRREIGLTQEQVAAAAGMNVTQYNAYERGRSSPTPPTLERLANALRTSQEMLLGYASSVRASSEPRREALKRLKADFETQIAAVLGLGPADIRVRIELL